MKRTSLFVLMVVIAAFLFGCSIRIQTTMKVPPYPEDKRPPRKASPAECNDWRRECEAWCREHHAPESEARRRCVEWCKKERDHCKEYVKEKHQHKKEKGKVKIEVEFEDDEDDDRF